MRFDDCALLQVEADAPAARVSHVIESARPHLPSPSSERVSARCRAASTNCGSFIVTSACSGVFVRSRRTVQFSRMGALKMSIDAGGALRFQKVYRLRRYSLSPCPA